MNREESLKEMMKKDEQYGIYKELTAVEWLVEQVNSDCLNSTFIRPEVVEKAKKMEKEQIIDAHECGYTEGILHSCESGEQYYNERFNK